MLKHFIITAAAISLLAGCCGQKVNDIIPVPVSVVYDNDRAFTLTEDVVFFASRPEEVETAEFFAARIKAAAGFDIKIMPDTDDYNGKTIKLELKKDFELKAEGYKLEVDTREVEIEAGDAAGLFYGMESFFQLLPPQIESTTVVTGVKWKARCVNISDYPRFAYRGLHLDPCRHFWTAEEVKKQIDVMALYKINTLHFHLTDDQGWRIEIKKYPKLMEVAAYRMEGEGYKYGGYYTQEELKDIVAYASARHIKVIPEIELPGHELAAIAAYPELSCTGKPITPRIIWGVEDILMCPGKEDMFVFWENVIKELVEIFPSDYYHIGGDECPKVYWEKCPLCQKRIKKEGLDKGDGEHTPEQRLQSYVVRRVETMLAKYGKKIIGWDEILEGGLAPTATVMSWRGEEGGIAAASMDHDVIMTPSNEGMYIDQFQGDPKIEPVSIGGYDPLGRVYAYDPIPQSLKDAGKGKYVLGVQTNSWSEYMYSSDIMEYRVYPRVIALSEIAWSPLDRKDLNDFYRRINGAYERLDYHGINYHIPQPEQPGGSCNYVAFTDNALLSFKTSRPIKMVYTLDGSDPDKNSKEYKSPISISATTDLKICSVLPSGKTSPVRTIKVVKEQLRPAASEDKSNLRPGVIMSVAQGMYLNTSALNAAPREWKDSEIMTLNRMPKLIHTDEQMRDVPQYAAIGRGYFMVPEDGVYYFSSDYNEVSVDGELLIDNNDEVKRFSRHDHSIALAAGLHKIEAMFLGHIIGGWPSNWVDGEVYMRKADSPDFVKITELYHK